MGRETHENIPICCQMLHGAGIFTYIYPKNDPNVGKYSSTMEHLGFGSVLEHVPPFIPFRK